MDKELVLDAIIVGHHYTLSDSAFMLLEVDPTEISGIRNVGHSTNKPCVSNVSSTEVVSYNHEQTEKYKEEINHELNDTNIGKDINKVFVTIYAWYYIYCCFR